MYPGGEEDQADNLRYYPSCPSKKPGKKVILFFGFFSAPS